MEAWQKVYINSQNIEFEGNKAIIKMPHKSDYDGWKLYHPRKLIREAGHKGYRMSMSFTNDWTFKLYRKGKHQVIDTAIIMEIFGNDNLQEDQYYLEVIEPQKIDKDVSINKELMRNVNE